MTGAGRGVWNGKWVKGEVESTKASGFHPVLLAQRTISPQLQGNEDMDWKVSWSPSLKLASWGNDDSWFLTQASCNSPLWQTKEVGLLEWSGFGVYSEGQSPKGTSCLSIVPSWDRNFATSKSIYLTVVQKLAVWEHIIWHKCSFSKMRPCGNSHRFKPPATRGSKEESGLHFIKHVLGNVFFFSLSYYYLAK